MGDHHADRGSVLPLRGDAVTARRAFGALLLGAALTVGAPPALAGDDSYVEGRCGFRALSQGGDETWTGEVDATVVLLSRTHGNVVAATVTCELVVDGVVRDVASGSGAGVVAFVAPFAYEASDVAVVELCTRVDFLSDATPTQRLCPRATTLEVPPQHMTDMLNWTFDALGLLWPVVDPVACEVLRALAPGAGDVTINEQGDVFVSGEPQWDCPPYDIWGPPADPGWDPFDPPTSPDLPTGASGAGWNDGMVGFLALLPETEDRTSPGRVDLVAACGYVAGVGVVGRTVAAGADETTVRCRLVDPATNAAVYDETATAPGLTAAVDGGSERSGLTVCTEGRARWGTTTRTVGPYCRPAVTP